MTPSISSLYSLSTGKIIDASFIYGHQICVLSTKNTNIMCKVYLWFSQIQFLILFNLYEYSRCIFYQKINFSFHLHLLRGGRRSDIFFYCFLLVIDCGISRELTMSSCKIIFSICYECMLFNALVEDVELLFNFTFVVL